MSSSASKKKAKLRGRKKDRGGSEFTRAKLEQEYNPKLRLFKKEVMSMSPINQKERYGYMAKQQSEACDQAIQSLKNGCSLFIDWQKPEIFRATQTKSTFPRLKTQPIPFLKGPSVEEKRMSLVRMLQVRHAKNYMKSRIQLEQQRSSYKSQKNEYSPDPIVRGFTAEPVLPQKRSLQQQQDRILSKSNLQILKDELKEKFVQIRDTYHKVRDTKRDSSQMEAPLNSEDLKPFFKDSVDEMKSKSAKKKAESRLSIASKLKKNRSSKKKKPVDSQEEDILRSDRLRYLKDRVKNRYVELRDKYIELNCKKNNPKAQDKQNHSAFL